MNYISVIKTSFLFFPLIAFLITIPYILKEYHKYGSVYWLRVLIVYSFILYLMTAYFLIILPLPSIDEVAKLTTPTMQLIPFTFVSDFIHDIPKMTSILMIIKQSSFYVPLFNLFLFLPLGVYLRYYFKLDLKKTVLIAFLISLFFEVTQLTGLYYIYPRGYRLFDVDDLMINTLGGLTGYFVGALFIKILPSREEIDSKSLELGTKISFLRRILVFSLDLFIYTIISSILWSIFDNAFIPLIAFLIYYILIPIIRDGRTIIGGFLNIKIVQIDKEKSKVISIFLRQFLFYFFYFGLQSILLKLFSSINIDHSINLFINLLIFLITIIMYFVTMIKIFRKKQLFYEKLSNTKLESTIKKQEQS